MQRALGFSRSSRTDGSSRAQMSQSSTPRLARAGESAGAGSSSIGELLEPRMSCLPAPTGAGARPGRRTPPGRGPGRARGWRPAPRCPARRTGAATAGRPSRRCPRPTPGRGRPRSAPRPRGSARAGLAQAHVVRVGIEDDTRSSVSASTCSRSSPSEYVFPEPDCPHMNVCRLNPPLSSAAGTPGAWNSSPIVSPARAGLVRPSTAPTSAPPRAGSARRGTGSRPGPGPTPRPARPAARCSRGHRSLPISIRVVSAEMSVTWPSRPPSSSSSIT